MAAKMEQVQLIDQAQVLQKFKSAIDGDARDIRIDLLRPFENFPGVEMLRRAFHYLKHHATLACQANAPSAELALETAGRLMNIDTFTGGNAMW